jgi:hypothetical protein
MHPITLRVRPYRMLREGELQEAGLEIFLLPNRIRARLLSARANRWALKEGKYE